MKTQRKQPPTGRSIDATHYLLSASLDRERVPSFEAYPFCLPAVRDFTTLRFHPAVTFLIGENGTGKSTLLEALAVVWGFNPEGGSRHYNFASRASHSDLHRYLRLVRSARRPRDGFFLRAESFFNVATQLEEMDGDDSAEDNPRLTPLYGGRSLHEQSHGESFLALLTHRFRGRGLYLLDEPEAALSPVRQMAALARIHDLVRRESQFIIATHSPIIMAYPNAMILHLSDDGIRQMEYKDTEYYRITREFLGNPEKMLKALFDEK